MDGTGASGPRPREIPFAVAIENLARLIISETELTERVLRIWELFRARFFPGRRAEAALVVLAGRLKQSEESCIAELRLPPLPFDEPPLFASHVLVRFAERVRAPESRDMHRTAVRLAREYLPPRVPPDFGYSPSPEVYALLGMLEAEIAREDEPRRAEAAARAEADEATARREREELHTWALEQTRRVAAARASSTVAQTTQSDSSAAEATSATGRVAKDETSATAIRHRPGRPTERDSEVERFALTIRAAHRISRKELARKGFSNPSILYKRALKREEYGPHLRRVSGTGRQLVEYTWID